MFGIPPRLALFGVLLATTSPAFCAIRTSFASAMVKVFLEDPLPTPLLSTWTVSMARGEQESFQLLINAERQELKSLSGENSLDGPSQLGVRIRVAGYIRTAVGDARPWSKQDPPARIGWWPDPLLPMRRF